MTQHGRSTLRLRNIGKSDIPTARSRLPIRLGLTCDLSSHFGGSQAPGVRSVVVRLRGKGVFRPALLNRPRGFPHGGYAFRPARMAPSMVPSICSEPGNIHSSGSYRPSLYL